MKKVNSKVVSDSENRDLTSVELTVIFFIIAILLGTASFANKFGNLY